MKSIPLLLVFTLTTAVAGPAFRWIDPSFLARAGYDSNPIGSGGASAALLGNESANTWGGSATFGVETMPAGPDAASLVIGYTADATRYEGRSSENFSTHRLSLHGATTAGGWSFSTDVSELLVAGSADTLTSTSSTNANAIALWRERRAQWQHRVKLRVQSGEGRGLVRLTGSLLDYDYGTDVVSGKVAFADRLDAQVGVEGGWRISQTSLCLLGVRLGKQNQAIIPLPNYGFDYDNTYVRPAVSWEGGWGKQITLLVSGGPDYRRYTGAVDLAAFGPDRNRSSLWYDASVTSKLSSKLSLTGKAARTAWLSSTGKCAYMDTSAEVNAVYNIWSAITLRALAKYHACKFFPALREDAESFYGFGATGRISKQLTLSFDLTRHRGWNTITSVPDRAFQRVLISFGVLYKL